MIAHINNYGDEQTIKEHLQGTAERAEAFATEFDCGELGRFCGLLHDIGKYSEEFQRRIRNPKHAGKVDHSTAGAIEAIKNMSVGHPMAMAIAGHHSGLLDGGSNKFPEEGTYFGRLNKKDNLPDYSAWKDEIKVDSVKLPDFCNTGSNAFTVSFFIRMMYSCLVDADYLDTEYFMRRGDTGREQIYASTEKLLQRFESYVSGWFSKTEFESESHKEICTRRNEILKNCMNKGERKDRGLYTLTVPTGGGKTTASLGFALKHMVRNDMRRIIYVIPYTSIIDQNAEIFRTILGEENVVEHHSGILYELKEEDTFDVINYRKALATENWDAPIIVTTAVRFFESLFSDRSSQCRRLHNIANSIIIFDEAQTIPVPYLKPCIAAISELVANYRTSVVLCTATQPALDTLFCTYLPDYQMVEICEDAEDLQKQFCRTTIKDAGTLTKSELLECMEEEKQILCIVNRRAIAQELYNELEKEGCYCLTTLLCPVHRREKIEQIKSRLEKHLPCRVVATSLVEAGVDLDFPKVYRQEIGLDSLIQSAGRCNREGKRKTEESIVYMFGLEGETSEFSKQNINALRETMRRYDNLMELNAISYYFQFYRELFGEENLDQNNIIDAFLKGVKGSCFPFRTVSRRFKLIDNNTKTIYIPLDKASSLIDELRAGTVTKNLFRKLGQYGVNVYDKHFEALLKAGCLETIDTSVYVLRDMNQYRLDTGLQLDVETGFGFFV